MNHSVMSHYLKEAMKGSHGEQLSKINITIFIVGGANLMYKIQVKYRESDSPHG